MPQSELDRVQDFERLELAKSLIYARREFSDEARDAGYLPLTTLTYSAKGGFPEIEAQMQRLLEDRDTLSQLVDEWTLFAAVYEKDRSLLRSRWYDPIALLRSLEDLQREPLVFTAADGYDPQRRFFISDDEIDRILRGSERSYESRLDTFSFFSRNTDTKERERFLKQQHGEYSGYHGGNDNQTYTSAGLSFSHGSLGAPYAQVELKWPAITKRFSDMISLGRFLYPSDAERMADYEVKQLAKLIMNFFRDAPGEYAHPTEKSIFDYWDGVADIQGQLADPERVREIYETMMLPLWNATLPDDRFYPERKRGMEAMQAYQAGSFSVFGRNHTLRPLPQLSEAVPPPENKPTERAFLDKAKYLIDSYCQEVFGQDADYSDLSHVDLAYGSTSDSLHTVEIFADLSAFRLVYQVDKETLYEISCDSLQELDEYLANLEFDTMIAHAEELYQARLEDTFDDIDPEQIRENLAQRGIVNGELVDPEALDNDPFIQQVVADAEAAQEPAAPIPPQPKPKRERITFDPLYPEIPREQRTNFRITDPELGYGTASEKYATNVAAIRMLKRIEDEGRLATPVEQEILSRYVGWGGLADCFDEKHSRYQELKALLSEEEYAAARASSLTAFYTSPVIIQSMYQALEQMGFREGNILEPSCGVGNFIGMIPGSMAGSHAYGVELDSISGRIAQQLYQNSSIAVTGFEKVQMPDSFFDVAIGNVPFGDFKVLDKRYDKHHWLIHDYFFGKTLDKVRPGGIVAFITSKGTMDKENSAVRKYLAQRADLIGAIRLPNTAFKRNAGTEVTSDILFLQKRDRMTDIEPDWVHLDTDPNGIRMNSYFVQHPEMILGEMVMESTRFGMDSVCRADENADLSELLQGAIQNLHAEITEYQQEELEEEDNSIPADPNVRNFSYTVVDGKAYFRENSRMNPVEVSVTAENRIRGMIALRDCVRRLIDYQTEGYPDEDIQKEQAQLNTLYDEYTKKYGLLSSRGNSLAFGEDSSYFLLCSLEVLDEEGNFKRKADMFTKRTIRPHVAVTSVDTASEALAVSIAEKARVDMPFMAELSGKTEQELEAELAGVIFRNVNCAERKEEIPVAFVDL
ncbi:MAG: helicase SNF2, partial [Faecousia sp.]